MNDAPSFRIGPWTAIPSQNLIECDSRSIRLEPRAMDVLVALARAGSAVVSIESLMTTVWKDVTVGDGSVYLVIGQLRQALGNGDESTRYIETIPKRGYRLTAPVQRVDADIPAAPAARSVYQLRKNLRRERGEHRAGTGDRDVQRPRRHGAG